MVRTKSLRLVVMAVSGEDGARQFSGWPSLRNPFFRQADVQTVSRAVVGFETVQFLGEHLDKSLPVLIRDVKRLNGCDQRCPGANNLTNRVPQFLPILIICSLSAQN